MLEEDEMRMKKDLNMNLRRKKQAIIIDLWLIPEVVHRRYMAVFTRCSERIALAGTQYLL